ncbi:MAG: ABC transporter ATP-binding protein [Dissulfuribacterales bacterium]
MLQIKNLNTYYASIAILRNLSLHVRQGEIVCLIGANGAGKTTLLRTISGLVPCSQGEILYRDRSILGLAPDVIVKMGIGHSPEGRQVFAPLTVMENLELGAYHRFGRAEKTEIQGDFDRIFQLFPRLYERRRQIAGTLSGGEQQMLAIGRALMAKPNLLLLDEPSLGLAPKLVEGIFQAIVTLNQAEGLTILIVEQNARRVLEMAHRGYVLETGRIVLQGTAQELRDDSDVQRAYLGKDYAQVTER